MFADTTIKTGNLAFFKQCHMKSKLVQVMLLGPFLALNFSIKRMLDPLGTFKMASKGFDFARSRTFKGPYKILQGLMIVSTGSIALLSSPLAFIQWASKTMASKTNAFLRKSLPKKIHLQTLISSLMIF